MRWLPCRYGGLWRTRVLSVTFTGRPKPFGPSAAPGGLLGGSTMRLARVLVGDPGGAQAELALPYDARWACCGWRGRKDAWAGAARRLTGVVQGTPLVPGRLGLRFTRSRPLASVPAAPPSGNHWRAAPPRPVSMPPLPHTCSYELIQPGEPAELVVLSADPAFQQFKVGLVCAGSDAARAAGCRLPRAAGGSRVRPP